MPEKFLNLPVNKAIQVWSYDPICAQCYFGGPGIAICFVNGADIVLCGRVVTAERQTKALMSEHLTRFSCLRFQVAGSVPSDSKSGGNNHRHAHLCGLRTTRRSCRATTLSTRTAVRSRVSAPSTCSRATLGSTMALDMRTAIGRPFFEYWLSLLSKETAHLPDGRVVDIPTPPVRKTYEREQPSYDTKDLVDLSQYGVTTRAPLGYVIMVRSGKKSSSANLGLFVRNDDGWDWLRTVLSTQKLRELLGMDDEGKQIDRCEFPNIRAVHFLLKDHLDLGFNSTSSFDSLGKKLCEYISSKHVDLPNK